MPRQYIPIFIYLLLAAAFPAVTLIIFKFVRPDSTTVGAKLERFYIVAILYVIFDVEIIFLFPWAIRYSVLGAYGLLTMVVFLGILIVGYIWLYKKGALDWV